MSQPSEKYIELRTAADAIPVDHRKIDLGVERYGSIYLIGNGMLAATAYGEVRVYDIETGTIISHLSGLDPMQAGDFLVTVDREMHGFSSYALDQLGEQRHFSWTLMSPSWDENSFTRDFQVARNSPIVGTILQKREFPGSSILIASPIDGSIREFDRRYYHHSEIAISPDGTRLAYTMMPPSATITVLDLERGVPINEFEIPAAIATTDFLDRKLIFVSHADGQASIWNSDDGTRVATLNCRPFGSPPVISVDQTGQFFVVLARSRETRLAVISIDDLQVRAIYSGEFVVNSAIGLSPRGDPVVAVLTSSRDYRGTVHVFAVDTR